MADKTKEKELGDSVYGAALEAAQQQKPTYAGTFDQQLEDLYNRMQNREEFSYDVNADPLYQTYKDKYVQQGKLAMKDTMGQAAALTGGYGSTYGQQVGQQAYDAYLQSLGDVIPELYNLAYKKYSDEGDKLLTLYGLTGQQRDTEYNRWRDELGDWNYQQELARQQEQTDYNRRISEENTAYSRQQSAYNQLYSLILNTGYMPTEAELSAAGMPLELATRLRTIALMKNGSLSSIDDSGNLIPQPVAETPVYSYSGGGVNKKAEDNGKDAKDNISDMKSYLSYLGEVGVSKNNQLYQTVARQIAQEEKKNTGSTTQKNNKGNGGR